MHCDMNDRTVAPYQYKPLDEDLKEIRLMTLHDGDFTSDIKVSLHIVSLTPESPPSYEALSYVWGSQENPVIIHVDGGTLAITRNLAEALPYLRYKDKPRILWIDAICVNQGDLRERGKQVKRMVDLYKLADRVVVWLGPAKDNSDRGVRSLDHLGSQIEVDWVTEALKPASEDSEPHWTDFAERLPYGEKELLAIHEVLSRPWFERLWVQQEIRMAKSNSIFLLGSDTIDWQLLRKAIICLSRKSWNRPNSELSETLSLILTNLRAKLNVLRHYARSGTTMRIRNAMNETRLCKCLDPRDRVYAILNLLHPSEMPDDFEPDYRKTTTEVYQDVALRYIAHHDRLSILQASGLKTTPSEMPTWVPDWTVMNEAEPFRSGLASGRSDSIVQYKGADVLRVTGIKWATVQYSEKIGLFDDFYQTMISELLLKLAKNDIQPISYVGGGSLLAAYCHTLVAGEFAELYGPPRKFWPRFQQSLDFVSAVLQPARQPLPEIGDGTDVSRFLEEAHIFLVNRSFVKTREGYIGLAPPNAMPGDHVCVLLGSNMPMLLRPALSNQFEVVGECYVHGLMNGEALLGPLPDHYSGIAEFQQQQSWYVWGFLDNRTSKVQYNDPRLESVPNYDPDYYPILTPEVIEERGVKLRTFDLI